MSLTLALEIAALAIAFAGVIWTVLSQGRKSREEFQKALHGIDLRVGIIDSHTSGNATRFNRMEEKIESLQKSVAAHTGKLEYLDSQVDKAERSLESLHRK